MIDVHTHILPGMDDGSKSVTESIEMLKELKRQGVEEVVLSSHYYAEKETPDSFFARREKAYSELKAAIENEEDMPKLRLAAEICYYVGVSILENKRKFCIEGTSLFLLELPLWRKIDRGIIDEVIRLSMNQEVIVLLAHVDRYIDHNPISVFEELAKAGVLIQFNTDFIEKHNKRIIKKMNKKGWPHFIGSDCHNTEERAPKYQIGYRNLVDFVGEEAIERINYYEEAYFN